ncbi:MAG: hypothetical protein JWP08_2095 [Bryobacterales bacterium]|nr:hypothetical protein [Bryobacterales bacterium]
MLQADLATATNLSATLVDSQSQAYQSQASQALQTTLELRNGQWRITGTIFDLSSQRVSDAFVVTQPKSSGIISAANALAIHLDEHASAFSTRREDALQKYEEGVTASDPNVRMNNLQKASELDPTFGLAYLSAIELTAQTNPSATGDLLQQASGHKGQFIPLDRVRLDAISARLSHAPLAYQIAASARLARLTPNSLDALVSLASLRFLQGDGAAGKQLMQRSLFLRPGNVTVRAFLALGLVQTRDFRAAEGVYQSLEANPATLPELAMCVFLEGDAARADSIFARYLKQQRGGDESALLLIRANWLALTGRIPDAISLLRTARFSSADLRSLALSQSCVWNLMSKEPTSAHADAAASLAAASSGTVKALAVAANAIAFGNPSADTLRQHVNTAPLSADQKAVVLAYGLFLNDHYPEAANGWRALSDQSGNTDLRSRAMLAASLTRAGRQLDPKAPPVAPFIPNFTAGDQYAAVAFAEMRRLLSR